MNKKINSMKKITAIILSGVVLFASSCSKQLDINNNPNAATSATPELILPQALNYTAGLLNSFNTYGAQVGGYAANAGGDDGGGVTPPDISCCPKGAIQVSVFPTKYNLLVFGVDIVSVCEDHDFLPILLIPFAICAHRCCFVNILSVFRCL